MLSADQSGSYYVPPGEVMGTNPAGVEDSAGDLVDLKLPSHQRRFSDLERRILELEREIRFQDEKIRNLDRTVDDIKRRNLR